MFGVLAAGFKLAGKLSRKEYNPPLKYGWNGPHPSDFRPRDPVVLWSCGLGLIF